MTFRIALALLNSDLLIDYRCFLGIWRAQQGPGPYSLFMAHPKGMLECWAKDGKLWGKVTP